MIFHRRQCNASPFWGYLLSPEKDMEFQVNLPIFLRRAKLLTADLFIQYLSCLCPLANFYENIILVKK